MKPNRASAVSAVCVLSAFCILIGGAMRYNLAAVSAALRIPPVIIIDAGHGGEDGGATGVNGASESMLNLEIALRLEQMLAFCGYDTLMTRSSDNAIYSEGCETYSEKKISDLKNRVALINSNQPAVLVSIHQNHFPQEQYSGSQVFYGKASHSKELGLIMQSYLKTALQEEKSRPCKAADSVYLMEKIQCPGVLIECGFLSNGREEALLRQGEYQKKIVSAITGALTQYTAKDEVKIEV